MRTTKLFYVILTGIILSACDRSNMISDNIIDIAGTGEWRVTLFNDSGNDETSDFSGYTFTFSGNGTLTAVKSGVSSTGTWSVNTGSNKFIIDLGPKSNTNKPLGELTDDWKILSNTATEIRLADDNTSSNEFLTFSKN